MGSKLYRCPGCGFVGYPEIARKESLWKNILVLIFPFLFSPRHQQMVRNSIDYSTWNKVTTSAQLRCPKCKAINAMIPLESADRD